MNSLLLEALIWIGAAGLLGFLITLIFADWLKFSRRRFLLAYLPAGTILVAAYFIRADIRGSALFTNWPWGLLAGVVASILLVSNVQSQPKSRQDQGPLLAFDLAWLGLAYGFVDGLFLNVMPVLVVLNTASAAGFEAGWAGQIGLGMLALLASLLVALTYHLGYPEFRDRSVLLVLIGNGVITLAYLVSGSPLAALLSHAVMHLAAVLQGPETTVQLPPHRQPVAGASG